MKRPFPHLDETNPPITLEELAALQNGYMDSYGWKRRKPRKKK